MTPHTLAELFTAYQAEHLYDAAPVTRYQHQLFMATVLRELGPLPLEAVTPEVIRTWKMAMSTRLAPGSVRRYMKMLSAYLRFAVEDLEWMPESPMRRVRKPRPQPAIIRFLSADEREALLPACQASFHPYLYAIVIVALGTGGRKEEIRNLCWPEVDLEAGVVRFLRTKNTGHRSVPMLGETARVLQALAGCPAPRGFRPPRMPWVFPAQSGRKPTYIEEAWRHARRAAKVHNFRFHDLRHTFASYLAMSGASLRDIAELMGHKRIEQVMAYAHLTQQHTRGIVEHMHQKFLTPHWEKE
jgi:integrase